MKRFLLLAVLLIPSFAWAGGNPSDWRISGSIRPGVANGQVVLEINDHQVASALLANDPTLTSRYQNRNVTVRCRALAYPMVACNVLADGKILKTVYFDRRSLR
ncbi:MAG: hypothetical protein ACE5K1_07695 [Acidiferrobacterales bacterium]